MELSYDFKFGDLWLSEFGGVTTTKPNREVAEYDGTLQQIAGKSGDEYIDNHRYKNVSFTRKVGFNHRRVGRIEFLPERVIDWLAYAQGYQDFEDTLHEGLVTKAALVNFPEVVAALNDRFYTAALKFSRLPFWYRKDSLEFMKLDISAASPSVALSNPYKISSEPSIMILFRSGDTSPANIQYSLTNGGETTTFTYTGIPVTNSLRLFIDCEAQQVTSGAASSDNLKYLDYPLPKEFKTGVTTFRLLGDLSRIGEVSVAPRWRCL